MAKTHPVQPKPMKSLAVVHWDKNAKLWRVSINGERWFREECYLRNCYFYVQQEGLQIYKERKMSMTTFDARFPHAYVMGELILKEEKFNPTSSYFTWSNLHYNPDKHTQFQGRVHHEMDDVHQAAYVHLTKKVINGENIPESFCVLYQDIYYR